jgi:hypothetical protein
LPRHCRIHGATAAPGRACTACGRDGSPRPLPPQQRRRLTAAGSVRGAAATMPRKGPVVRPPISPLSFTIATASCHSFMWRPSSFCSRCWKSSPTSSSSQSAVHSSWFSSSTACASSLTTAGGCVRGQGAGPKCPCTAARQARSVQRRQRMRARAATQRAQRHLQPPIPHRPPPVHTMRGKLLKGVVFLQGDVLGNVLGLRLCLLGHGCRCCVCFWLLLMQAADQGRN